MVKNPPANAGDARDMGSNLGLRRPPRGGNGNPLPVFLPGNPMDRGAWLATVHGVTKELDTPELTHAKAQFHTAYVIVTQISQCMCAFFLGRVCVEVPFLRRA